MGGTKISPFCKGGIKGGLKNEKGKVKINPPISPFCKGGPRGIKESQNQSPCIPLFQRGSKKPFVMGEQEDSIRLCYATTEI
jgi:hypothetical protein